MDIKLSNATVSLGLSTLVGNTKCYFLGNKIRAVLNNDFIRSNE